MQCVRLFRILCVCCVAVPVCDAQQAGRANAITLLGCWRLEAGPFSVVGTTHVDSGQTTLPQLIRFDTIPGRSFMGEPIGRRVRALGDNFSALYHDGYYQFPAADSLRIDWTSGFVGLTLDMRLDSLPMRGVATAWTDYEGNERATILLRRTNCPNHSRSR